METERQPQKRGRIGQVNAGVCVDQLLKRFADGDYPYLHCRVEWDEDMLMDEEEEEDDAEDDSWFVDDQPMVLRSGNSPGRQGIGACRRGGRRPLSQRDPAQQRVLTAARAACSVSALDCRACSLPYLPQAPSARETSAPLALAAVRNEYIWTN